MPPNARNKSVTVVVLSETPTNSFVEQWYELADDAHFWMEWRLRMVERQLHEADVKLDQALRVLDIGGGHGVLARSLEGISNWKVDVADLNRTALESAGPRRGQNFFYDIFDRNSALLNHYDGIVLYDVLEHLAQPSDFLNASLAHLKPGGFILVNVPALPLLHSRYDDAVGHYRRYTRATLTATLIDSGLSVRDVRYWGFSLVPLLLIRKGMLWFMRDAHRIVQTGWKPPSTLFNRFMHGLRAIEQTVLSTPPLGTSVAALAVTLK